jgi:hypothetical protein
VYGPLQIWPFGNRLHAPDEVDPILGSNVTSLVYEKRFNVIRSDAVMGEECLDTVHPDHLWLGHPRIQQTASF